MKNLFYFFTLLSTSFGFSQTMLPTQHDTLPSGQRIEVMGAGFYHTSSIQNKIGDRFLFGGHISEDDKDLSAQKIEEKNTLGGDLTSEIVYYSKDTLFNKNPNLSWYTKLGTNTVFGAEFKADVFQLLMYGNKSFSEQGEVANLNQTYGMYYASSKVGIGLYNRLTKTSINLNAVVVNNYLNIDLNRGEFYTDKDGDEVLALSNGEFGVSQGDFFNGFGLSLDVDHYFPIRKEGEVNGFVQIRAHNIGIVKVENWNSVSLEGTLTYNGFNISSIREQTECSLVDDFQDSLGVNTTSGSKWILIPGMVQVGKIVDLQSNKRFQTFFGVRAYLSNIYLPMVYFGGHYKPYTLLSIGSQISYGGFGGFRIGTYFTFSTSDKLAISLGTEDLLGALNSRQYGQSALIGLSWRF